MRASLSLALTALFSSVVYGFSSSPPTAHPLNFPTSRSGSIHRRPSIQLPPRVENTKKVTTAHLARMAFSSRGGAAFKASATSGSSSDGGTMAMPKGAAAVLASVWGTGGVLYILGKAVKRVVPIALEPFQDGAVPLSQFQLGAYIVTCLWFAYVEGYKGFQTKFSPLVVKRSLTLQPGKNGTSWYHFLLAPFYSMGLMHATKKRKIVSWSVTTGVALIVAAVKRAPYPYRNIVDAGVVAGLTWGSLSILLLYVKAFITGNPPAIDAALPEGTKSD